MNKKQEIVKNKPWKKWRTRKLAFMGALIFVVVYTINGCVMGYMGRTLDSSLTELVKWVVVALITGSCILNIQREGNDPQ